MLGTIGSIVLEYWTEFLLGLIVTAGGFFIRHYLKLSKAEREEEQKQLFLGIQQSFKEENDKFLEEVIKKAKEEDSSLQKQIDMIQKDNENLRGGLLSIQGRAFKAECRKLLSPMHTISLDEWEEIDADHEAYNRLGGNHKGDELFRLVKEKALKTLTTPGQEE